MLPPLLIFTSLLTLSAANWNTKCSSSNETSLCYKGGGGDEPKRIYNTLVSCPQITSLKLDFVPPRCSNERELRQFTFYPGDRFPTLTDLSLSGYYPGSDTNWVESNADDKWLSMAESKVQEQVGKVIPAAQPECLCKKTGANLESWLKAMDWTKIQRLHLGTDDTHFYDRMKKGLIGLRQLSVRWFTDKEDVSEEQIDFIRSIPPLESISVSFKSPKLYGIAVPRPRFPLTDILKVHGSSLRNLSLHHDGSSIRDNRRPMLSIAQIDLIEKSCPKLEHFGLDLDRNETFRWPGKTINRVLQISTPTSLDTVLELGVDLHEGYFSFVWCAPPVNGWGPWREPRMSLEMAEKLFADFRSKKKGQELLKVMFTVGDAGIFGYSTSGHEDMATRFECDAGKVGETKGGFCKALDVSSSKRSAFSL